MLIFPGMSTAIDFDPAHQEWFIALAAWFKLIAWWLLTIWITCYVYKSIHDLQESLFARLESADIHRISHNSEKKGWINLGLNNIPGYGILKGIIANLFWKAGILAGVLIFAGLVGGQFMTGGGITNWVMGGSTIFSSLASAILPTYGPLQGSVFYLCMFIPMDHALNCGAIWLACNALKPALSFLFGFWARFTP